MEALSDTAKKVLIHYVIDIQQQQKPIKSGSHCVISAVFKVPIELCVKMYAAAVLAYSKQSAASKTRLTEIHFVDKKVKVIQLIQDEFR